MNKPDRKLNPLLRLAAISGVVASVMVHIQRGDDLNTCDHNGATPLMLAAGKKKNEVVKLLLEAGADPNLFDSKGWDALAYAKASGCSMTINLLSEALGITDLPGTGFPEIKEMSKTYQSVTLIGDINADLHAAALVNERDHLTDKQSSLVNQILVLDDDPLDCFEDVAWETESATATPDGDDTITEAVRQVHETIVWHKPVDTDEDWGDTNLFLPDRSLSHHRDEGWSEVRNLFLWAIRERVVPEEMLVRLCSEAEGSCNVEMERLLEVVIGDLGANIVAEGGDGFSHENLSLEEEALLIEAEEFVKDLASGYNNPSRFYAKDIHGYLLSAEEEIALSREIEEGGHAALESLARWPSGLAVLYEAAEEVACGTADPESFSTGSEPQNATEEGFSETTSNEDSDEEAKLNNEAATFVAAVTGVQAAGTNIPRIVEALDHARLARGFLSRLAEKASNDPDPYGRDFAEALQRQSDARERMIVCNLRLALSIAKKHLWSGLPFDDLTQEANIGLMKAVERYDWRRGFRFSTYATWWIRQQITRYIANTTRIIRVPVHAQEAARKFLQDKKDVETSMGRPETISETTRRTCMSIEKIQFLLSTTDNVISLDELEQQTGSFVSEISLAPESIDPAVIADKTELQNTLHAILKALDERQRGIILMRFGLNDEDEMTLEEVGGHFGVTRERIRQIESKTLKRLSCGSRRQLLAPFMNDSFAP